MARRRVNYIALLVFVGFIGMIVGGGYFLHKYQIKRNAQGQLQIAEQAIAKGDDKAAAAALNNYIHFYPEDPAAYLKFAELTARQANANLNIYPFQTAAFDAQEKALRFPENREHPEILRNLADLCKRVRRFDDAIKHYSVLLKQNPDDVKMMTDMADCYAARSSNSEALSVLYDVIRRDSSYLPAYMRIAEISADNLSALKDSQTILKKMTENNGKSAEAYALKARFLSNHDLNEDAKTALADAIKIDPENKETLVSNVEIAMKDKRFSDADTALALFQKIFPDDERGLNIRTSLELQQNQPDKAEAAAREIAQRDKTPVAKFKLLDVLIKVGKLEEAEKYLAQLRNSNYPDFMLEFFDGQISIFKKQWREAAQHFNRAKLEMQNYPDMRAQTNVFLGICYEQLEQYDRQLEAFKDALAEIPQNVRARTGYALALFHLGRKAEAREELVKVKDQIGDKIFFSDQRLRVTFYQLELARQQALPPEQRSEAVLQMFSENTEGTVNLEDPIQVLSRCEVLVKQKKYDQAERLLLDGLKKNAKQASYWSALAMISILQEKPDQAKKYIADGKKEAGFSPALLSVELKEILSEGKESALPKVDKLLKEADLLPVEQKIAALKSLSEMYIVLGAFDKAQQTLQAQFDLNPENTNLLIKQFQLARVANNEKQMDEYIQKIKDVIGEKTGEYPFVNAAKIVWQVRNNKLEKAALGRAKDLLRVAYQARTNWVDIPQLSYEIAVMENSTANAIEALMRIRQLGSLNLKQSAQLVHFLYNEGRLEDAKEILDSMGDLRDNKLSRLKISIEATTGDINAAFETAKSITKDSDKSLDLLWFGQIALKAGKLDDAQAALKRSLEIDPKNVDAALALISVMKEKKDFSEIDSIILNMDSQCEGEALALGKAKAMKIKGDAPATYTLFSSALERYPYSLPLLYGMSQFMLQTTRPHGAMPYLQRIMQLNDDKPDPNLSRLHWARRNYVRLLLSVNNNMENQDYAIKLLDTSMQESETPEVEDVKMKAIILVSRNNPRDRSKAIQVLEGLVRRGVKLEPKEQFIFGRLYNESDQWDKAKQQMLDLCVRDPNNIRYITEFVRMMFRRNRPVEEIQPYVARLEQLFPNSVIAVLLRSELLHIQDKDIQSAEMLMNYFKTIPEERYEELPIIARQLNRIGQLAKAEEAFKIISEKMPKGLLDYVDFLARWRRLDEAIGKLEAVKGDKRFTMEEVLKSLLDLLRVSPCQATPGQLQKVSEILESYRKDAPQNLAVKVQLAEFRMLEGKVDEAEKIYDDIIKNEKLNDWQKVVFYNNQSYALSVTGKNPQKALDIINEAIKIHGPAEYLLDTRALALLAFNDKDPAKISLAVSDLEKAVAKNPTAIYYFHLARAYLASGDRESAKSTMDICRNQYEMTILDVPKQERGEYGRILTNL